MGPRRSSALVATDFFATGATVVRCGLFVSVQNLSFSSPPSERLAPRTSIAVIGATAAAHTAVIATAKSAAIAIGGAFEHSSAVGDIVGPTRGTVCLVALAFAVAILCRK